MIVYTGTLFIVALLRHASSASAAEPGQPASVDPSVITRRTKIIGGEDVDLKVYPWFAGVIYDNHLNFAGSLVAPEYVLTNAGSIGWYGISEFKENAKFVVGFLCNRMWDDDKNCGQEYKVFGVRNITLFPGFNTSAEYPQDDIALIRLDGSSDIEPVKMSTTENYENEDSIGDLFSIGLGAIQNLTEGGYRPTKVMEVNLDYVDTSTCAKAWEEDVDINESFLCIKSPANVGKSSCDGDEGGPLYDQDKKELVGVLSYVYNCDDWPDYPELSTRISSKMAWIQETICDSHDEPKPDFCTVSCTTITGKDSCESNESCAFGNEKIFNCRTKEGFDVDCSKFTKRKKCNSQGVCAFKSGTCVHKCDTAKQGTCKNAKDTSNTNGPQPKICKTGKKTNSCANCHPKSCTSS